MSIRRLLLIAFLLLTFLATALMSALTFVATREVLSTEIGRSLDKDAQLLMGQVDRLLFERLQNVQSWSRLDVMQEARVGDVDKRLARFLADIRKGYGELYTELYFADPSGRVVASSDAARIGRIDAPVVPWIETRLADGPILLAPLRFAAPYVKADLVIRAVVADRFLAGDLGQIAAAFDLRTLFRLLDEAEGSDADRRYIALLDPEGVLIAGSRGLRDAGLLLGHDFAGWRTVERSVPIRSDAPLVPDEVLVGQALSRGFQGFPGLNWSVVVYQSAQQAFRSIRALLWLFAGAFGMAGLIAGVAALGIAGRVARPLVRLTGWARSFLREGAAVRPPAVAGTREVQELCESFGQMVDDLERSRQQVVHAAKLAVVGEMAAIMAHEVRTPLGILHTSAQMLAREPGLSAEGRELTGFLLEESARLERLISTLLECARPRPLRLRPTDLHGVIRGVADLLAGQARKKQLQLVFELNAATPRSACDEELMMQVFLNLVMNAIQMTPVGGSITLASHSDVNALVLEVRDSGPGVPAERRASVFDPFVTTREGGIGLGLTVTRQIVDAHGGTIEVDAADGGGAVFRINLPQPVDASGGEVRS